MLGKRQHIYPIVLLICVLCISVANATSQPAPTPKPGSFCPGPEIRLVVAEELSASLDLTLHSMAALVNKNKEVAFNDLNNAGTILYLAASRGAAARSNLLLDAVIQAKHGEDFSSMLDWFPLLQTSLQTIPDDPAVTKARTLIFGAEDIMQYQKDVDPIKPLKEARHMLACDALDLPLQEAKKAQQSLMSKFNNGTLKNTDYSRLLDPLRSALAYSMSGNVE